MSEFINLAKTLESSLTAAVRSSDGVAAESDMPGLSQFDTYSLLNVALLETTVQKTSEELIYEISDTQEIEIIEATEEIVLEDIVAEATEEIVLEDIVAEATEEIVLEDIVAEAAEEIVLEEIVAEAAEEIVLEDIVAEEIVAEAAEEIVLEDIVAEDIVAEVTEEIIAVVVKRPIPIKTEEELWLESNEFGLNEIDVVADNVDYFELLEEPDSEPVASNMSNRSEPKRRTLSEDQVVLVVEQLVVNPNQPTTIVSQGEATVQQVISNQPQGAPTPQNLIYQTPQQSQQIVYSAAPVALSPAVDSTAIIQAPAPVATSAVIQAPISMPMPEGQTVLSPQPVAAPQQPQFYQPPAGSAPIVYQQAPVQEISVNVSTNTPAQSSPVSYVPTTEQVSTVAPSMVPQEEQAVRHFDQRDADQIIEIRSDATSVSANTVSVSSSSPAFPSLANFDPRKYFSPNEISAPRMTEPELQNTLTELSSAEPSMLTYSENLGNTQLEDSSNGVSDIISNDMSDMSGEPEDMQKVTKMFQELRRIRER